jgi:hypothetical protein
MRATFVWDLSREAKYSDRQNKLNPSAVFPLSQLSLTFSDTPSSPKQEKQRL